MLVAMSLAFNLLGVDKVLVIYCVSYLSVDYYHRSKQSETI